MAKNPSEESYFMDLVRNLKEETDSTNKRFDILYYSKGFFSGTQAAEILRGFKTSFEKLKVIKSLEKRLCRMTCAEGREILLTMQPVNNDRLTALGVIKRTLIDHQCTEGMEYILSAFPFHSDKLKALGMLTTVSSYVADQLPSGGHQQYAAVGGLYSQNFPLRENLFGPLEDQLKRLPGGGSPAIAHIARPGKVPSLYISHPSYKYDTEYTYMTQRGYPGARGFPEHNIKPPTYPSGAPPLGYHQSAPAPTGYQTFRSTHGLDEN